MTEDQANLTRCCGPEGCGGNSAGEAERYCLASRCMGWRWVIVTNPDYQPPNFMMFPTKPGVGHPYLQSNTDGFCGLAGKP